MPTDTVVVTPEQPAVTIEPGAKPAPAAAAQASAPAKEPSETDKPSWLDARLERERAKVLKDLGLETLDEGRKTVADAKAKRDAEKTAEQKALEASQRVRDLEAKNADLLKGVAAIATERMAALTEAQRTAVAAITGDDPSRQLDAIGKLAPTWANAPAATPAAKAGTAIPADTAPKPSAPDGKAPPSVDHRSTYQSLRKDNPVLAARYAEAHPEVYERASS